MRARLTQVQSLRALAALLVLASHLQVIESKYGQDTVLPDWFAVGFVGVDLFFVISGFIMSWLAAQSKRGPALAGAFAVARAGRIYPLYWTVTAAVAVLWLVRPDMVFASSGGEPDLLRSFFLIPDTKLPLLAVGWTLIHELYFYIVLTVILLLPRLAALPVLLLWGAAVLAGYLTGFGMNGPTARILVHPLTFEFILGALAGAAASRSSGRLGAVALVTGFVGMGGVLAYVIDVGYWKDSWFWTDSWMRPALFAAPSALLVYGFTSLDQRNIRAPALFVHLGDQSYALYLTHILSLSAAGRVWQMLPQFDGPLDNVAALAGLVLAAYLAAEIAYRLIDRAVHRSVQKLTRGPSSGARGEGGESPEPVATQPVTGHIVAAPRINR